MSIAFEVVDIHVVFGRRAARHLDPAVALASLAAHVIIAIALVWVRATRTYARGSGETS